MKKIFNSSLFFFCLMLGSFENIFAQDGSLDLSFDSDGKVTTDFGNAELAHGLALQADGKIIVIGTTYLNGNFDVVIARYKTNGSLDSTFNNNGKVLIDLSSNNDVATSVAIQSDGKIVVGGYYQGLFNYDFFLLRYNSNGLLDSTFDNDGIVTTDFNITQDLCQDIKIQSDGKIVAVGITNIFWNNNDFAIARYNTNGTLDTTFDNDGKILHEIYGTDDDPKSIVIDNNGKIVIGGTIYNGIDRDFGIVRYNSNGSIDSSFSDDGIAMFDLGGNDMGIEVNIQPNEKIVIAGFTDSCFTGSDFIVLRCNNNGTLDSTFDSDGVVKTDFSQKQDFCRAFTIQSDGKIVLAGQSAGSTTTSQDLVLVRYNSNGSVDSSFDSDGKVNINISVPGNTNASAVEIQQDGKIVVAGYSYVSIAYDFAIFRLNNTISVGLNTLQKNNTVIAYPIPTYDYLLIKGAEINTTKEIYNNTGGLILVTTENKIDVSSFINGIYFLKVNNQTIQFVKN